MPNYNAVTTKDFGSLDVGGTLNVLKRKFQNSAKALDTFYSFSEYLLTFEQLKSEIKLDDLGNSTTNWIMFFTGSGDLEPTNLDLFIRPFVRAYTDFVEEYGVDVRNWAQEIDDETFSQFIYEQPFNAFVRLFNIRVDVYDNPNIKYVDVLGGDSTFKNTTGQSKTIQLTGKIASPISEYFDIYKIRAFKNMMDYPTRVNFYNPELERIYGFSSAIVKNYSIRQNRRYNNIKDISATLIAPK